MDAMFCTCAVLPTQCADTAPETKRRVRLARERYDRFKRELYDTDGSTFSSEARDSCEKGGVKRFSYFKNRFDEDEDRVVVHLLF